MIKIENKIISRQVFKKKFLCDLTSCKGACCVEGQSGAPLSEKEDQVLKSLYKKIKPFMKKSGVEVVDSIGVSVVDQEGDLTTPLIKNRECAFSINENGITKCSIEKAYLKRKINFKKPLSCQLFPIRITEYSNFDAVNYEEIDICKSACEYGKKNKTPLYVFVKEALIQKYGKEWYAKLLKVAEKFTGNDG